jgi:hypothetical protein
MKNKSRNMRDQGIGGLIILKWFLMEMWLQRVDCTQPDQDMVQQ